MPLIKLCTLLKLNHMKPNDYNLYNMAGNVSEWVDSSYEPSSYDFSSNMNPNVNDPNNLRKVVRGGSWKRYCIFFTS